MHMKTTRRSLPVLVRFAHLVGVVLLVVLAVLPARAAFARQDTGDSPWAPPTNLSRSGGTTHPSIFIDPEGVQHVLWDDNFGGVMYTQSGDGQSWAEPVTLNLPFGGTNYQVAGGANDRVTVFWIDERGRLVYSQTPVVTMGLEESWPEPVVLLTGIFRFHVAVSSGNSLYVAVLRVLQDAAGPAGIYATSLTPGNGWSEPALVYQSPYLRTLNPQEGSRQAAEESGANAVQVNLAVHSTEETDELHLVWDNPALKRVFYARSTDGGATWQEPQVVDGPRTETPYLSAYRGQIFALDGSLLRLWQAVESGGTCAQKYQASRDGGETWEAPGTLFGAQNACPEQVQVWARPGGEALALVTLQSDLLATRWNGQEWTVPVGQREISAFVDPENFYAVQLGCPAGALAGDQLFLVGCDLGPGGDIWQTRFDLTRLEAIYNRPSVWSAPLYLGIGAARPDSLAMASDESATVHVLWGQPGKAASVPQASIYYAAYQADMGLTGPYIVLEGMEGAAGQLNLIPGSEGRLFAAWTGGLRGAVRFSWANVTQASTVSGWSPVVDVQSSSAVGREPVLAQAADGTLHALYTIPVNENRGVYATRSNDGGKTWSEPVLVWAADAACDVVEQPRFQADGSRLFAQWVCATPPGGVGPLGLYAAASADGGASWSAAEAVLSGPVTWNELIVTPTLAHRLWMTTEAGISSLWHAISSDGGATWQPPDKAVSSEGAMALPFSGRGPAGHPFLTYLLEEGGRPPAIYMLLWDGAKWLPQEGLVLNGQATHDFTALAAAAVPDGRVVVALANSTGQDSLEAGRLTFASFQAEGVEALPTAEPGAGDPQPDPGPTTEGPATGEPAPTLAPSATPQPQPTLAALPTEGRATPVGASTGLMIAVGASALLIGAVLGVRLLWNRFRS